MSSGLPLSEVAALVGDPSRANMLEALLGAHALTATELAHSARVSAATASEHLSKLVVGGLLAVTRQGRHRYYRLGSPEIGRMLEGMLVVAAGCAAADARPRATPRISPALREARTCYDHLAGRLGVGLADALVARGAVVLQPEAGEVTESGRAWLAAFGVPIQSIGRSRRLFCRPCLDWSERRPHLAGTLGALLCRQCEDIGWFTRARDSRAVTVTAQGRIGFERAFGLSI